MRAGGWRKPVTVSLARTSTCNCRAQTLAIGSAKAIG